MYYHHDPEYWEDYDPADEADDDEVEAAVRAEAWPATDPALDRPEVCSYCGDPDPRYLLKDVGTNHANVCRSQHCRDQVPVPLIRLTRL